MPVKWALRRNFSNLGLLSAAEKSQLFMQFFMGRMHEPEFEAFADLKTDRPVLDIGANFGQSAISILSANADLKVISFEPNPLVAERLSFTKSLLGADHQVQNFGLGATASRMKMFIPVASGVMLSQEATFDRSLLTEDKITRGRILSATGSLDFEIRETEMEVRTIDSLNLDPGALKIDVQGLELEVLRGGIETLKRSKPFIMVESVPQNEEINDFLQPLGYQRFRYDLDSKELIPKTDRSIEHRHNWFYRHLDT